MKYWGYLIAKLMIAGALLAGVFYIIGWLLFFVSPPPPKFLDGGPPPAARNFAVSIVVLLPYTLFAMGLIWAIVWDQRSRCRTCLRRLRMPIHTGSWTNVLLGAPGTEYICPYGHGTLRVAELQITGHQEPDWQPHDDMWKELCSLEETKK